MALPVPDDTFAEILRRLTPKTLAVARCVCKPWRELVDGRELLLRLLLPRSVDGVLINYVNHRRPHLLSRPRSSSFSSTSLPASCVGRIVDGNLTAVPAGDRAWWTVMDHCDGLILCDVYWGSRLFVCNPATRRWATLPSPRPEPEPGAYAGKYLAFDPAVSPHYEVFLIPALPEKSLPSPTDHVDVDDDDEAYLLMEWPPSPYKVDVFSSATGRWVERDFVREEGEAVMTVMGVCFCTATSRVQRVLARSTVCAFWRFSTSSDKYQVIKTPIIIPNNKFDKTYLGKSKMGVSFGFIDDYQLSVWILKESAGQIEWVLNYQHDLWVAANQIDSIVFHGHKINGPWVLEETIPKYIIIENKSYKDPEWDSDNDDFLDTEVDDEEHDFAHFRILGFHPYKKVIFLEETFRTFAYHLNSSKIQYLGYSCPKYCYKIYRKGIHESFVYTPGMIGELNGHYAWQSSPQ
uniref:F-box domain-containing protein n=1 Tax=Oryza punctata TaxID=4537 RepID=A0A0E0MHG2_ORYPU